MTSAPESLAALAERFEPGILDVPGGGEARVRLEIAGQGEWDAVVERDRMRLTKAGGEEPDALIAGDRGAWARVARDYRGGLDAFRAGSLVLRRNLHLGVGFLAATSGHDEPGRLRFDTVKTDRGKVSLMEAGQGEPVLMLHGLGATKAEFMPTLASLAEQGFRAIALDLPGFGDSDKPFPAAYNAAFFARWVEALLDALELDSAHVLGHSMGGRVAIEVGIRRPDRTEGLVLITPSLAWLTNKRWAPWLRLVRPELGALQLAPRPIVERIVKSVIPGSETHWTAAGIDEFLRAYLTPRGRVAFYAAARNIYLEDGTGPNGFWERIEALQPRTMFIWGRRDRLVPIGFEKHVKERVPHAEHVEIDCAHVPQMERPKETHRAIAEFLSAQPAAYADEPEAQRA
ncbi:MAG: alpha/beta fold hydrolase [Thermoleophilaceae bacterium]